METTKIAYLIKQEDGYHVQEVDGTVGPLCTGVTTDGFIKLSANGAERKYYSLKKADAHFAESDEPITLTYREPRTGMTYSTTSGPKTPDVTTYLSEEEQTEFAAIVERGQTAMNEAPVDKDAEIAKLNYVIAKAAYDIAVIEGREVEEPEKPLVLKKTFIDFLSEADYARYNELVDKATEAKKAAVAEKKKSAANSPEAKKAKALANLEKAKAALAALLAEEEGTPADDEEITDEE